MHKVISPPVEDFDRKAGGIATRWCFRVPCTENCGEARTRRIGGLNGGIGKDPILPSITSISSDSITQDV